MTDDNTRIDETLRIVKSGLLAYVLGDNGGLMELSHPQCTWTFPGDPTLLPWGGTYRAREIETFMERVKDSVDIIDHIPHTFLPAGGGRVVVLSRDRARAKATGRFFDHELLAVATVREGQFYRWEEYGDTADMEDAFRELDEAGGALDHACAPPPPLGDVSQSQGAATRPPAQVAEALLTHLVTGDATAAKGLVHPDAQLSHPGDPERLPWAGRWAGREIEDLVQRRKDGIEVLEHRVDRVLPVGATHGVIQAWERARIRATGRVFENRYACLAQVSGGRCESLWIYADTGALHRAFAPPQWSQP